MASAALAVVVALPTLASGAPHATEEPASQPLTLRLSPELAMRPHGFVERARVAGHDGASAVPLQQQLHAAQNDQGAQRTAEDLTTALPVSLTAPPPGSAAPPAGRHEAVQSSLPHWAALLVTVAAILLYLAHRRGWQRVPVSQPSDGRRPDVRREAPRTEPKPTRAGRSPGAIAQPIETLAAALQQADFFLAGGRHRHAIEALRSHIDSHPQASPGAWLELLDLHHRLGHVDEYRVLCSEFLSRFGHRRPEFEAYAEEAVGLEACPAALARIAALWPSAEALQVIEDMLVRPPAPCGTGEAFSLPAYRELMLLHRVGRDLLQTDPVVERTRTAAPRHAGLFPLAAPAGLLPWVFPAQLLLIALDVLLSGRDLNQHFTDLEAAVSGVGDTGRHPVALWLQRGVSLLLLGAAFERIYWHVQGRARVPSLLLLGTLALYWLTTVPIPGLFGAIAKLSHEHFYAVLLAVAMALSGTLQLDHVLGAVRNALFIFLLASFALLPLMPNLVMDGSYAQGLVPGMPRFGGLAPHPVGMGLLSWTALVCLWVHPFARRELHRAAWAMGLLALLFAQSKTAWVAFILAAVCLLLVRGLPGASGGRGAMRPHALGVVLCAAFIAVVASALYILLVSDFPTMVLAYLDSSQGAQLRSLTGRDKIWAVALEEWGHHPVFGYGLTIWDEAHRQAIGMPFAVNAHNQFIDTLARSGTVGFAGLVVYAVVLTTQAFRYAAATGGLSLALWSGLALMSISEVPLLMFGMDTEVFMHLLLIASIAAAAGEDRSESVSTNPARPARRRAGRTGNATPQGQAAAGLASMSRNLSAS